MTTIPTVIMAIARELAATYALTNLETNCINPVTLFDFTAYKGDNTYVIFIDLDGTWDINLCDADGNHMAGPILSGTWAAVINTP
jgi:hypothetical protein